MQGKKLSTALIVVLAMLAVAMLMTGTRAAAQTETLLLSFNRTGTGTGGLVPYAGLIFDGAGNLYGTTAFGGTGCITEDECGTVFKLTPKAGGGWTETVLHDFQSNGKDGFNPLAGLIFDGAGNLYGTTYLGGAYGAGTVFELEHTEAGGFAEKILYSFGKTTTDGIHPYAGVILDAAGNLYGTTSGGGLFGEGTAFELKRTPAGGFAREILHNFGRDKTDGETPYAGVIFDAAGNLYGTTAFGGSGCPQSGGCGMVFELAPTTAGSWTETVLHAFDYSVGGDGANPQAGLIFDAAGNLYGTTTGSDASVFGFGTVFELSPTAGGTWTEQILHEFCSETDCVDGIGPQAGLIFDASGNLYGTADSGGLYGYGTAFELTPTGTGSWTETVLNSFGHHRVGGGSTPLAGLIFDASGNLYGTTTAGGKFQYGTVFEITP